jgi:hypothetical protein
MRETPARVINQFAATIPAPDERLDERDEY